MPIKTIDWINNRVRIIDQTALPASLRYLDIADHQTLGEAIKSLKVRGAPAVGIAAAFAVVLGIQNINYNSKKEFFSRLETIIHDLSQTRPTAVNLFWALQRMRKVAEKHADQPWKRIKELLLSEALTIAAEDKQICRKIGQHGSCLIENGFSILTHCNAGGLATADYGTALGIIYAASEQGKKLKVYVDETRPLLQGSRLTAWELTQSGIDTTVICDNAAAFVMKQGLVNCIIVGADRIAKNGDTANKIGTYNLAVLAEKHGIPFYVAAPLSTFDFNLESGDQIPIEERSPQEVTHLFGRQTAPLATKVYNPAFDVTPNELITAIITEKGILEKPLKKNIQKFKNIS